MKTILPWFVAIVLLVSGLILFSQNRRAEAELADLRPQSEQLKKFQAEKEELKRVEGQLDELARLRKDNEELHRLRNEVRQLRELQKQQAAGAAQPNQTRAGRPAGVAGDTQQLQQQLQQLAAENERLRAQNSAFQQSRAVESQVTACINNLRILEGAKEQWALENRKTVGTVVNAVDVQPYLRGGIIPTCPAGGVYSFNSVGVPAACNLPGHAVPQQ
jgi:benzoyl-CoA reductase/2-hydroxyglutaryl-CoA dehydratase subunit BcrC/BadD/HgdB